MRKIRGKISAVEMETIIIVIIILISAVIIIGAIYLVDLTGRIDKEACHASVLARSIKYGDVVTKSTINLQCKTEHVCITLTNAGKGCGVNDYKYKINPGTDDQVLNQIQEEIAGQFYDCWWMLGEGRADFFDETTLKNFGIGTTSSSCVICSVLTFDDGIKSKFSEIDISSYLNNNKVPGKDETFLQYFTSDEGDDLLTKTELSPIDTTKEYGLTFMGLRSMDIKEIAVKDLAALGLFTFASKRIPIVNWIAAKTIGALSLNAKLIIGATIFLIQEGFTAQSIIYSAIHCDGNMNGCSMLILSEYNSEQLGKSCSNIESIP